MTSLTQITGIHFFQPLLLCCVCIKWWGYERAPQLPYSKVRSVQNDSNAENKCHENNLQFTGDRPHGNIHYSQVSQALPRDFFSWFSPISAEIKNVLFCFQHCHPSRQHMGKFWGLRYPYKSLCWVLLLDRHYWWACEEWNSSPSSASSHKFSIFP